VKPHAFLPLLAALLACPAFAADQAPRPPQAPTAPEGRAAAKGKGPYDVPCPCGNGCGCNGTCGCGTTAGCSGDCWPGCETPAARGGARGKAAWQRAVDGNLPYVVWVGGFACPACERECADAVHVHVDSYRGDDTPRVEVGKPDGAGGLDRVASLTGAMGPGRLRGALEGNGTAAPGFLPTGSPAWHAPRAAFYAPPPTPFFGGVFGGVFGGGCASCGRGR
jgi:hypothetical protein